LIIAARRLIGHTKLQMGPSIHKAYLFENHWHSNPRLKFFSLQNRSWFSVAIRPNLRGGRWKEKEETWIKFTIYGCVFCSGTIENFFLLEFNPLIHLVSACTYSKHFSPSVIGESGRKLETIYVCALFINMAVLKWFQFIYAKQQL